MNILDPKFRYHNASTHDADSRPFRDRQRARMAKAAADAQERTNPAIRDPKVRPIKTKASA